MNDLFPYIKRIIVSKLLVFTISMSLLLIWGFLSYLVPFLKILEPLFSFFNITLILILGYIFTIYILTGKPLREIFSWVKNNTIKVLGIGFITFIVGLIYTIPFMVGFIWVLILAPMFSYLVFVIFLVVISIVLSLLIMWFVSFSYFSFEGSSLISSFKKSINLILKHWTLGIKTGFLFIGVIVLLGILGVVLTGGGVLNSSEDIMKSLFKFLILMLGLGILGVVGLVVVYAYFYKELNKILVNKGDTYDRAI